MPKIRFAEFTGDWKETPMGALLSFKNGYNAGKEQYGTGKKFINVLDIIENDYITHDRIIGQVDIPSKDFEKNEVKFGDILFQRSSETREEVGQANVYLDRDKTATFGGFVIRGRSLSHFNPVFFNAMLKTAKARKDITSRSGGSTRYNIGQESLEDVLVSIAPTLPEQHKIADFLTAVDGRIGQLMQKKALLEDYKKGVMQGLFAPDKKNGECRVVTGECPDNGSSNSPVTTQDSPFHSIRFKDDHGKDYPDWEEKKLGDCVAVSMGQSPPSSSYNDEQIGIPLVQGNADIKNGLTAPRVWTSKPTKDCRPGDIIISVRAPVGAVSKSIHHACLGRGVASIYAKESSNNEFIFQWLKAFEPKWKRIEQGSTFTAISGNDLKTLPIDLPDSEEQTKIADFLSAIDRKIESVATQITETQAFKRGLLQQMFV